MSKTLKEVNKELNKEYPKFLKAIPKLKNKEVFKQKIWILLEELRKVCLHNRMKL